MIVCFLMLKIGITCERLRRPDLLGKAFALVGDDRKVQVASDEATACGVSAGQTISAATSLCPVLTVLPYDAEAYHDLAQSHWDLCARESSFVEPISPETCFVDISGPGFLERTDVLSCAIGSHAGVVVQTGVARTKFSARWAAFRAPSSGVAQVKPEDEASFLAPVPLSRIPALDSKQRERLSRLGIHKLGDVAALPLKQFPKRLHEVVYSLQRLAIGEDGDALCPSWPPRNIRHRFSFDGEVDALDTIHAALGCLAEKISSDLIYHHEYCKKITFTIQLADGKSHNREERISLPIADLDTIYRAGCRLLQKTEVDQPALSITLEAGNLGAGGASQQALFGSGSDLFPMERNRQLSSTLAYLRQRPEIAAITPLGQIYRPRNAGLWTYSLGRSFSEPIHQVFVTDKGIPFRFVWRRRDVTVFGVQNKWREREWFGERAGERTIFRVNTDAAGFCELEHGGDMWRLRAMAD